MVLLERASLQTRAGPEPCRRTSLDLHRQAALDDRARSGRTAYLERSPERLEPIAHVLQARAAGRCGRVEAFAIVLNGEGQNRVLRPDPELDAAGLRIFRHVLERFETAEIDRALDFARLTRD